MVWKGSGLVHSFHPSFGSRFSDTGAIKQNFWQSVIVNILCVAGIQKLLLSVGTCTAKTHYMILWLETSSSAWTSLLASYFDSHHLMHIPRFLLCQLTSNGSSGLRQQQGVSITAIFCNCTSPIQNFTLVTSCWERSMCAGCSLTSLLYIWPSLSKSFCC